MNVIMRHIFKKNAILVFTFLFIFLGVKIFSVVAIEKEKQDDASLKSWLVQMRGMDQEERKTYINQLMLDVYGNEIKDDEEARQLSLLYAQNKNLDEICYLIDFAKTGEGVIANTLPSNYLQLLDFYSEMRYPDIIYTTALDRYFSLQEYNMVPFLAFLLVLLFFSEHYETQVYTYVRTTKNGELYNKRMRQILLSLCFGLFIGNECFDLVYSGVLTDSQLLRASIQSYYPFVRVQMDVGIGQMLLLTVFSKVLGLWILCQIADGVALKMKNMKDAVIGGMFFFLSCYLLTSAFEGSCILSCIQVGVVNWKNVIAEITYCMAFGVNYYTIGLAILVLLAILPCIKRKVSR